MAKGARPVSASDNDALARRLASLLGGDRFNDVRDSLAINSWRSYRSDLLDYDNWCCEHERSWSEPATIAAYFRDLETRKFAYATIERRKTAIAKLVSIERLARNDLVDDPTKHVEVTTALQAIRRRIRTDQTQATPLTGERLIQVLLAIDPETMAGERDLALLLLGFYGGFRRSELSGIRKTDLEIDRNGVVVRLRQSKTSQDQAICVPIHRHPASPWCPVKALETWLEVLNNHEIGEVVWPRLTRGDNIYGNGTPLKPDAINQIVIRRVADTDLANPETYSAHSLRSGFITEAKNRGIDEADIMKHTRHKSLQQMRAYDRQSGWWNRNATTAMGL